MMKLVDHGRFNEPVAIQGYTSTPDGAGGSTDAWADIAEWSALYAEFEPLTGNEQIRAMQTEASSTIRVRMWAIEGVKSTTHRIRRLRDDGIVNFVAPPAYDPTRLQMEILAREVEAV